MQRPGEDYAVGEEIARAMFAPVMRSHRMTLEQMAILEPALSETVGGTLIMALRQALDEAVRRGVPRDAAFDFLFGHINIELAIAFELVPGAVFSDAAIKAIDNARPRTFKPDWLDVRAGGHCAEHRRDHAKGFRNGVGGTKALRPISPRRTVSASADILPSVVYLATVHQAAISKAYSQ